MFYNTRNRVVMSSCCFITGVSELCGCYSLATFMSSPNFCFSQPIIVTVSRKRACWYSVMVNLVVSCYPTECHHICTGQCTQPGYQIISSPALYFLLYITRQTEGCMHENKNLVHTTEVTVFNYEESGEFKISYKQYYYCTMY